MSACRSCGAEIEWVETKNGRMMPLDVAESDCKRCKGEGVEILPVPGQFAVDRIKCVTCGGRGALRLSHFATCPQAAQHRKAR